jgi:acetyl-CoA carboxylase biotin carboxyl carrier protein
MAYELLSPLPGTFYRRAAPDQPPYKSAGDLVEVGEVVGLIEVMKQFSEVASEVSGRISRFLVEDEDPVESGQPLLSIEPG